MRHAVDFLFNQTVKYAYHGASNVVTANITILLKYDRRSDLTADFHHKG